VTRVLDPGRKASTRVVVDTSIWSLAIRRRPGALTARERALVLHWADLVRDGRVALVGAIRQEVLTGIREEEQFDRLRHYLRGFDDEQLAPDDFEEAAKFHNVCRTAGVAGSAADFLVCAVAAGRGLPVFTTDPDFQRYARHLPVRLYVPPTKP
jgi:predicted nucleic acid-binding protein